MWKEPPYFREILDPETPGVDRYIALVSSPDSGKDTEVHHIVPVAYFKDVLGRTDCRMAGSPDMNPANLVPLSKGRHVLAHFYLAKYAKKCIAVQMRNAFCQTYQTTDFSKVTEEEVLSHIDEINAEYSRLKKAKKVHKDGVEIRRTSTCVSMTNWKDGKKVGMSAKWYTNGSLRGFSDSYTDMQFTAHCHNENPIGFMLYGKLNCRTGYDLYIDVCDYQANGKKPEALRGIIKIYCGGRSFELMDSMSYGSYSVRISCYPDGIHSYDVWDKTRRFLHSKYGNTPMLSRAIRSIRQYAKMFGIKFSDSFSFMLSQLEDCTMDVEPFQSYTLPEFPGNGKSYEKMKNFDRVSPSYRKLTQVRGGKSVATYWWDERGKITGICQDGLPHIFYEKRHIQLNGWHDGAISNESHDIRLEVPEPWFYMSDEERLDFIKSRYPVFNSLNPIPPIPERILATLAKAA
jgi:hypothetical protein